MTLRTVAIFLALAILALYYSSGILYLHWSDSSGYLAQALSLLDAAPYVGHGGRNIGYPLFLALPLMSATPALAIILLQGAVVMAAYCLIHHHVLRAATCLVGNAATNQSGLRAWLPLLLVATASYGALHVLAMSLLAEVLFAVLALGAVLATSWFVLKDHRTRYLHLHAVGAMVAAALPLLVKPHWLIAACGLEVAIGLRLATLLRRPETTGPAMMVRFVVMPVVALAVMSAVTWPDRWAGSGSASEYRALFGPRTIFCNHLHLILDTAKASPDFRLHSDPSFEALLLDRMEQLRKSHKSGWKRLGFNGDLCTYDQQLHGLIAGRLPGLEARRAFYLGSVLNASLANPLPFAGKVLRQLWYGLTTPFEKFAPHFTYNQFRGVFQESAKRHGLADDFLTGTRKSGAAGPFASKQIMKTTVGGRLVHGLLAIFFTGGAVVYVGLVLASILLPPRLWSRWSAERRRVFLAFLGVPLVAIFGHHLLVALTHSFDVWRYGFNLFFVNIVFAVSAALFWHRELKFRGGRCTNIARP